MLTETPCVSIVTSVFNGDKYLEETIKSILDQTYSNIQYIIIDGGSTDNTLDIIKNYEDKIDYWISEKDYGVYEAWNKGLDVCRGNWIGFIGSDDYYELNAIEKYIEYINLFSKIEYVSSQSFLIEKDKQVIKKIGNAWNWQDFSRYMNIAHVGSLHHKSLFDKYGRYDPNFKICGDYEFLLRAGNDLKTGFIDQTLCNMRSGGISNRSSNVFSEVFRAKIKNSTRPTRIHAFIDMLIARLKWILRTYLIR